MTAPSSRVSDRIGSIAESATLAVDAKAKALKAAGEDVIGFGAGEPDFPTPGYVVDAAAAACAPGPGPGEVDAAALARMLAADDAGRVRVLDVREDAERLLEALDPSDHVPLGEVLAAPTPHVPGPGETLVVYCAAGVRSARAREAIVAVAPEAAERVLSLAGGLDAWTRG